MKLVNNQTQDSIRTYLREIGRVPLLTREQEILYGKQVQQAMSLQQAKEALAKKLGREPTLSEWAEHVCLSEEELTEIVKRGRHAKQKMIEANLRLVVSIAKKYQKRNMEFLDLIQEGSIGLGRAVDTFDPMRGFKFSTYAHWWIRQAVIRAIAQQSRTIRLPNYITDKLNKIKTVQRELAQKLGRNPTTIELAQVLKLEPAKIRKYFSLNRQPVSLDLRIGKDRDTELQELLEDESSLPDKLLCDRILAEETEKMLDKLTPQQKQVIVMRFGLRDGNQLALAQIGDCLNLSRERIRQIQNESLKTLRQDRQLAEMRDNMSV